MPHFQHSQKDIIACVFNFIVSSVVITTLKHEEIILEYALQSVTISYNKIKYNIFVTLSHYCGSGIPNFSTNYRSHEYHFTIWLKTTKSLILPSTKLKTLKHIKLCWPPRYT